MAYDGRDWTRLKGWKVDKVFDSNWDLKVSPPDKLRFHGDGTGTDKTDDIMTKFDGTVVATGCTYSLVGSDEQVEVTYKGKQYIITLDEGSLICVPKGSSSGSASWTAVDG